MYIVDCSLYVASWCPRLSTAPEWYLGIGRDREGGGGGGRGWEGVERALNSVSSSTVETNLLQ